MKTGEKLERITNKEKLETILQHLELEIEDKGETVAIKEMRKHISWYIKNMPGATYVREKTNKIEKRQELIECLTEYFELISHKME